MCTFVNLPKHASKEEIKARFGGWGWGKGGNQLWGSQARCPELYGAYLYAIHGCLASGFVQQTLQQVCAGSQPLKSPLHVHAS